MGSTGYLTCGLCHQCGNCYPRNAVCAVCHAAINLDDDVCSSCGVVIEEEMRVTARESFMREKAAEYEAAMPVVSLYAPGPPVI